MVGNIITAKDIISEVPAAAGVVAKTIAPAASAPSEGLSLSQVLKEVNQLMSEGKQIVDKIAQMQEMKLKAERRDVIGGGGSAGVRASPTSIPSTSDHQVREIQRPVKHDVEKIKTLLRWLLTTKAKELPPDVLEMKIGDLVCDNFSTFKYHYKSDMLGDLELGGEQVINVMASGLAAELDKMQEAS